MIQIKKLKNKFEREGTITFDSFRPLSCLYVNLTSEVTYYQDEYELRHDVAEYLTTFMPDNEKVYTNHVVQSMSKVENTTGKYYISEMIFQVLLSQTHLI